MSPPETHGQPVISYTRLVSAARPNTGSTSQDNGNLGRLLDPHLFTGQRGAAVEHDDQPVLLLVGAPFVNDPRHALLRS
jgi:hypothetical protein